MANLKISMACWMVADEAVTRRKLAAARGHGVADRGRRGAVRGRGRPGTAARLPRPLRLTWAFDRIECGRGIHRSAAGPAGGGRHGPGAWARGAVRARQASTAAAFTAAAVEALVDRRPALAGRRRGRAGDRGARERPRASGCSTRRAASTGAWPTASRTPSAWTWSPSRRPPRPASSRCSTTSARACACATCVWRSCCGWRSTGAACTPTPSASPSCGPPRPGRRSSRRSEAGSAGAGQVVIDCFPESLRPLRPADWRSSPSMSSGRPPPP